MIRSLSLVAGMALVAGSVCAQSITLTDGPLTLTINAAGAINPPVFSGSLPNANLLGINGSSDVLSALYWSVRLPNNNQNTAIGDMPGGYVRTNIGTNKVQLVWTNAGTGVSGQTFSERFDATLVIELVAGPGAGQGRINQTMTFGSSAGNGGGVKTFKVFNVIDPDVSSTSGDDTCTVDAAGLAATHARQTDIATSDFVDYVYTAVGTNGNFDAQTGSTLRSTFLVGGSNNMTNQLTKSGDVGLGLEWSLDLSPGQSQTVSSTFAFNIDLLATPACYANCTGNTDAPLLTASDFTCFLNKFRAGDSYANCTGNTDAPLLTASDFTCFLNSFRAGCP